MYRGKRVGGAERNRGIPVGLMAADLVRGLLRCMCPLRQSSSDVIPIEVAEL
jgi:hypothetical protein